MDNSQRYNSMGTWLEPVLARQLGPVAAPPELWERIQHPRRSPATVHRRTLVRPSLLMATAAAALLMAATWSLVPRHYATSEALVMEALTGEADDLDLRSEAASEIRTWVKARTGLDIPLPTSSAPTVRLAGVCAVRGGGRPAFRVAYRVGGRKAELLVSKASLAEAGDGRHRFLKCESNGNARVSSWTMRGQLYTLAYATAPGTSSVDNREECLLCHAGARHLTFSN